MEGTLGIVPVVGELRVTIRLDASSKAFVRRLRHAMLASPMGGPFHQRAHQREGLGPTVARLGVEPVAEQVIERAP